MSISYLPFSITISLERIRGQLKVKIFAKKTLKFSTNDDVRHVSSIYHHSTLLVPPSLYICKLLCLVTNC